MRLKALAVLALAGMVPAACVAPVGPVQVTRFHLPDTSRLGQGTISVEPAQGMDGNSLEWKAFQMAVSRQLVALGYSEVPAGEGAQVALVSVRRSTFRPERSSSPVSVGVGGSTGSYGSGLGVGIGINLSGKPAEQVETQLAVRIDDRATSTALWEGRASFTVRATSPMADTALGAPKVAEALFKGFPGQSGETIEVK